MIRSHVAAGIVRDRAEFMRKAVPIAIHGDGVPCTSRMSLDGVSWSSCLVNSTLPAIDTKWFTTGVMNSCVGTNTKDVLWTHICWSLAILLSGKHPMRNHLGASFAPGSADWLSAGKPHVWPICLCLVAGSRGP